MSQASLTPLFRGIPLRNEGDWREVTELLVGSKSSAAGVATVTYLRDLGATLALEELSYVDRDYRTTHAQFYSRQFRHLPQLCKRYHFFGDGVDQWSVRTTETPPPPAAYLGYIIRRPLPWAPLGRSVLRSSTNGACLLKNGSIPCAATFEPHIDGARFPVHGVPFAQQDAVAMTCAETSIWVAARVMTKRFKHPLVVPPMVASPTAIGFTSMGRTFPSRGLSLPHISHALNSLGLHPLYYNKNSYTGNQKWDPIRVSYPYLASGIPCVLGVPDHAVTACGFLRSTEPNGQGKQGTPRSVADWIPALVSQDDQKGPYRVMPHDQAAYDEMHATATYQRFLVPSNWAWHTTDQIQAVLAALPDKIYLSAENADQIVRALLSDQMPSQYQAALQQLAAAGSPQSCRLSAAIFDGKEGGIVYSLRCRKSVDVRRDTNNSGAHLQVRQMLTDIALPRYVWVAEITTRECYVHQDRDSRVLLGQIIMDATATRESSPLLFVHLMGFAVAFVPAPPAMLALDVALKSVVVKDDIPFRVPGIPGWSD